MANPEHIERLKQGVAEWNIWREENPWVRSDFSGAELHSANFSGASVTNVDRGVTFCWLWR